MRVRQVAFMGQVVNQLGKIEGELNVRLVCPRLVEQIGKAIAGGCRRSHRTTSAITEKIAAEAEVAVFRG